MTAKLPRAPALEPGTCLLTAALIESAQRVFFFRTTSAIHWVDLCTVLEAILLYDKIAFPMVQHDYAEPLVQPLVDEGIVDLWWPEGQVFTGAGTKEDVWEGNTYDQNAYALCATGWPDERYDNLSEIRKAAVDGVANGFAEAALLKDSDEAGVLLWGRYARETSETRFERTAASCLRRGIEKIETMSPNLRYLYRVPHEDNQDVYNHYAKNFRDLANDARTFLFKSAIEEPYFDTVSVKTAARDTLHLLLNQTYESEVQKRMGSYVRAIPMPPFAGIALQKSGSLNEVVLNALELQKAFRPYRDLLRTHRAAQAELIKSETLHAAGELEKIESSFAQALRTSMTRINTNLEANPTVIFDGLQGLRKVAGDLFKGDPLSILDRMAEGFIELLRNWYFMNYGGVYGIVSHFPRVQQLGAAAKRLSGKELEAGSIDLLGQAAHVMQKNYAPTTTHSLAN
ncbi:hypothetical protein [Rhizobium phaseoli]|uniref:Uncharacterized protein n=1 Tax=Rhizobium phaseoli TaxID=396 RepID=A0ABM6CFV4_9HYPH|nr:hypothetical protein [Rhizobium phaseoli]ANL87136.1 hypothetical protein AMC81_PA00115 [Rhizobium phaseoli]ANL93645.1 hypothetical protein AMC80_PA00115 [Rhizobium phaseoli]